MARPTWNVRTRVGIGINRKTLRVRVSKIIRVSEKELLAREDGDYSKMKNFS
jgi:hypothetical protein